MTHGILCLARRYRVLLLVWLIIHVAACGGGGSSGGSGSGSGSTPPGDPQPSEPTLDEWLRAAIVEQGLTGDPATPRQLTQVTPDQDSLVKLGQLLFFSHTLSGDLSVSCATCHQPDLGGGDALSIGIGVAPTDPATVGPARRLNVSKDLDPAADGMPNMHRNSQTVFNSALFDRSMTFDGRVFVLESQTIPGGRGQSIRTPESGNLTDGSEADGLLEVFSKFPLTDRKSVV